MNDDNTEKFRTVEINKRQSTKFIDNSVSTTKYRVYSFIPVFLYSQFRSYSNIFFLIVSIIQQLPGVSPLGKYTTLIPLTIILTITGLKELFEDILRHREDKKINSRTAEVWIKSSWKRVPWRQVKVGEFVRVKKNKELPADLILASCSDTSTGIAYVDTVNLDGESNLKVRRVPQQLLEKDLEEILFEMQGFVVCDHPNELIYRFNGMFVPNNESKFPVNEEQLMLRGAIIKNTDWICGLCVYTGQDTKIWRNSHKKELKRSTFDTIINWHMMVLFAIFFFLTVINSIMYIIWNYRMHGSVWYLPFGSTFGLNIETFLTFAVGYSYLIPISLQIYLEIIRLFQAKFINTDKEMFDEKSQTFARARSSTLNADLGVVKYIFTDKTGTLTQNQLEFRACSIQGVVYRDEAVAKLMSECRKGNACHHFFIAICVAPGVIPIFDQNENEWKYYSSSTDQLSLVNAAKKFGYELRQRSYKQADVMVRGSMLRFKILSDIEFTSERRRTTVIVRNPENKIVLYMIGADDVVFKRLASKTSYLAKTTEQVYTFALSGLRTMCLATAVLRDADFRKWNRLFNKAKLSLSNRQIEINRVADRIEKNLHLLGAVAQEDKLQDEVPQTISNLLQAGIKVWMLTGDKQETAINIGYSTKLLSTESTVFILDSDNIDQLKRTCVKISRKISGTNKPCLVVNGNSLAHLINSDFVDFFVTISMNCDSVICCRMIPLQKAQIVNFIQSRTRWVTLAIGDGANDVAMIQTAAIGVGISGYEGLQAVYAADYSIALFKHLQRLLLVHGTLNYYRMGKILLYIYYKNLPIALILFHVSYAAGWSGATIFDDWAFTLYNVAFTDGATLVLGIWEQDFDEDLLMNYPAIYNQNSWSGVYIFYTVLLNAVLHSAIVQYLTFTISNTGVIWSNGYNDSYIVQGNLLYTHILMVAILKVVVHLKKWTWSSFGVIIGSAILWFPVLLIYNFTWIPANPDMVGMGTMLFSSALFWVSLLVVPMATVLCDLIASILYRTLVADAITRAEIRRRTLETYTEDEDV